MTALIQTKELLAEPSQSAERPTPGTSRGGSALRWLAGHWSVVIAVGIVVLVLLWAAVPGLFTHYGPLTVVPEDKFLPPSGKHWFGTDQLGRDVFSRVVYGSRASLTGSLLAVGVGVVVGSLVGSVAGWFGGLLDTFVMRAVDVILSIPGFLLAITIVVVLGFGIVQAGIAVGLTSSATFARLIRSEVLKARSSNYVEAAVTSGTSSLAILWRHVIPNSIAPTLSMITVQFGLAIVWIASLSFLGLGAQPPAPEWGRLVTDGRNFIATAGWLTLFPALTIVVVVLATNHISHFISKRSTR